MGDLKARSSLTCQACHGLNAEGNELLGAPPLINQNDWYLNSAEKLQEWTWS